MIKFKKDILSNGLKVLVHEDSSTPLVAVNILYDVGSKDEDPEMTGIAHLFEHLMFGGSVNIPDYDTPLQMAGAENNAFTNNDFTNYYITIPSDNLETAFWLESDRMLGLGFSEHGLNIQKKVVTEEFKQRYLNQPYGDIMLLLRPLAYNSHPYMWPTIGKDISHIEKVELQNAKDFFYSHYAPNNAILSIAGNVKQKDALYLAEKWFGTLEKRNIPERKLIQEPSQQKARLLVVERDVPYDVIYKAWPACPRAGSEFSTLDLLTDILAGGESGRLYSSLVRERKLFSDINAYMTGETEPGLLILSGKLSDGVSFKSAEEAISEVIEDISTNPVPEKEINKVRNKFESSLVFSNTSVQNKAMNLCFFEILGDAENINREAELYNEVNPQMVLDSARRYLKNDQCSTLHYKAQKSKANQ
jgi:zinc protease